MAVPAWEWLSRMTGSLQGSRGPAHSAPEWGSADGSPDRAKGSAPSRKLALARVEVGADRLRLQFGQLAGSGHEKVPRELGGYVRIVKAAEMLLQGHDPLEQMRRIRAECFSEELQGIAQPLGSNTQLVESLHVGPRQDHLVGPNGLIG